MRFGVAVTAYRERERGSTEYAWIRDCLAPLLASESVSDVLVYSDDGDACEADMLAAALGDRVCVEHAYENLGVMGAKIESVARSTAEWVLMCDSDNVFDAESLALLANMRPDQSTLYSPSFGRPALDYRHLAGAWKLADAARLYNSPAGGCAVNTGNQFVHRDLFLAVMGKWRTPRWDLTLPDWCGIGDRSDIRWRRIYTSADSFLINAAWWKAGGTVEIVPGLEYVHGSLTPEHQAVAPSSWDTAPAEKALIPPAILADLEVACG